MLPAAKPQGPTSKQGFLAELECDTLTVMADISEAIADERLSLEELAAYVASLAQAVRDLLIYVRVDEADRTATAVKIQKTIDIGRTILDRSKA